LDEASPELLGFYVYELRAGHDMTRWCKARERHGPALRVTGVQHPAPPLVCQAGGNDQQIQVSAPYATPVFNGRNLRPKPPRTDLWALLYAQVHQLDGQSQRNVLLERRRLVWQSPDQHEQDQVHAPQILDFGFGVFNRIEVIGRLRTLGLPEDSRLSVITVEVMPEPFAPADGPRADPLGIFLGEVRILRASPLTPLRPICVQS
jgi:hypothetical protein